MKLLLLCIRLKHTCLLFVQMQAANSLLGISLKAGTPRTGRKRPRTSRGMGSEDDDDDSDVDSMGGSGGGGGTAGGNQLIDLSDEAEPLSLTATVPSTPPVGIPRPLGALSCWSGTLAQVAACSPGFRLLADAAAADSIVAGRSLQLLMRAADGAAPLAGADAVTLAGDVSNACGMGSDDRQRDVGEVVEKILSSASGGNAILAAIVRTAFGGAMLEQLVFAEGHGHGTHCEQKWSGERPFSDMTLPGVLVIPQVLVRMVQRGLHPWSLRTLTDAGFSGESVRFPSGATPWAPCDLGQLAFRSGEVDSANSGNRLPTDPVPLAALMSAMYHTVLFSDEACKGAGCGKRVVVATRRFFAPGVRPPTELCISVQRATYGMHVDASSVLTALQNGVVIATYDIVAAAEREGDVDGRVGHWRGLVRRGREWYRCNDASVVQLALGAGGINAELARAAVRATATTFLYKRR